MTTADYFRMYRDKLSSIYEDGEAVAIAEMVLEHFTGKTRSERVKEPGWKIAAGMQEKMDDALKELLGHRPVQYVLQEAWFCGLKFYVDESVLIPRPETELLVHEVIAKAKEILKKQSSLTILDIGTGSGCIPISIKKKMPVADVWAIDTSDAALTTAEKNAESNNTVIHFKHADITDESMYQHFPVFDIIASNPPYIPDHNRQDMHKNVLAYEPHTALFVPGDDALFFYRHIVDFCKINLKKGGWLFCEIHEEYGKDVADLFAANGFTNVCVLKDVFEKERVVEGAMLNVV